MRTLRPGGGTSVRPERPSLGLAASSPRGPYFSFAAPFFDDRERAALAYTEAVTLLAGNPEPTDVYSEVATQFRPEEVAALLLLIVTINARNALSLTTRAWVPESSER
jgi:alkylhydroperoxidase family enzyme